MKEEVVWGSIHAIIFLIIIFFNSQFFCDYCLYFGIFLIALGALIWAKALNDMGELRIGLTPGNLVTSGIYSRIRNPMYLGGKAVFLGISLVFTSWVGIILICFIIIPLHFQRARKEEKELIKKFGNKYTKYKDQSWF